MNKIIIYSVVGIILVGGIFWGVQTGFFSKVFAGPAQNILAPEGIVLFYGEECPHCKNVEDYIAQNKITETVKFTQLEVAFGTRTSSELLANSGLAIQLAKKCNLDVKNGVSIPFLYDGKNCLIGDVDIINFFKNAAGIK